ncbi:DUF2975 domain-containing protein [Bifidobacterium sp. ESL0790]|uniref:DUF2975 domain-containing protein n=1 Tax=Bifidobacterium sp. ESL0790 TaxID=2983233 RepID=UPI0023F8A9B0|nr:DUF2975 domain-containing protein [Bifidobacterium sp. ESL0790]WEV73116.1 DUF2975 domain-containing protein [Bifidobacterium sp. ESL0790]
MYETNKVDTFIRYAAKVCEWLNIIAALWLLLLMLFLGVFGSMPCPATFSNDKLPSIYGFTLDATFATATQHKWILYWYTLEGILILLVFAFALRNLHDAFKTMQSESDEHEATPFSSAITKNIHSIGVCLIVAAVIDFIIDASMGALAGWDAASGYDIMDGVDIDGESGGFTWLVIGLLIFCIARILRYGEQLQREHDELI